MTIRAAARSGLIAIALSGVAVAGLTACADERGPGYYPPYAEGRIAQVEEGDHRLLQTRLVWAP